MSRWWTDSYRICSSTEFLHTMWSIGSTLQSHHCRARGGDTGGSKAAMSKRTPVWFINLVEYQRGSSRDLGNPRGMSILTTHLCTWGLSPQCPCANDTRSRLKNTHQDFSSYSRGGHTGVVRLAMNQKCKCLWSLYQNINRASHFREREEGRQEIIGNFSGQMSQLQLAGHSCVTPG